MRFACRRAGAIVALGLFLSAPGGVLLAMSDAESAAFREISDLSRLSGVWRSRGYGWLISIERGEATFYDEAAGSCREDEDRAEDLEDLGERFEISADGRTIRLPLGDETYLYTFDKVGTLPRPCAVDADASPRSVLAALDEIFRTHYAFFGRRQVDWPAHVGRARARLRDDMGDDELFGVLTDLLRRTGDAHVSLEARIGRAHVSFSAGDGETLTALASQAERQGISRDRYARRWEAGYWRKGVARTLLSGRGRSAGNGLMRYGLVDRNIGYLGLLAMEGFGGGDAGDDVDAVERALERAMKLFAGAKAVILDITMNDGGHDRVARAVAGRFAAERTLAYYKSARDDETARPQAIHVEPSTGRRFLGPVYLVTSDVTLSAAEVLALAMRALPNVTHVGETTRGCLSDNLWKRLPNGWSVSLSNEAYLDRRGRLWEAAGIPPEIEIGIFSPEDVREGHPAAIRKVVELARSRMSRAAIGR